MYHAVPRPANVLDDHCASHVSTAMNPLSATTNSAPSAKTRHQEPEVPARK